VNCFIIFYTFRAVSNNEQLGIDLGIFFPGTPGTQNLQRRQLYKTPTIKIKKLKPNKTTGSADNIG